MMHEPLRAPRALSPLRAAEKALGLAALAALVCACTDAPAPQEDHVPSVRVFEVGRRATGQARRISGKVRAADRSTLSFGVGGQALDVPVERGDLVQELQVLARLDDEPYRIALQEAHADVSRSRAKLRNAREAFDRVSQLVARDAASDKELDAARVELSASESDVEQAEGAVERAEFDLERTTIEAPFGGQVVEVSIAAFEEVAAGSSAIVLLSEGAMKVELQVPETLIRNVDFGQSVQISFPSLEGVELVGTVSQIGAETEVGNSYPVTVQLADVRDDLRAGMTASVTFNFDDYLDGRTAYLVPLSAMALDAGALDVARRPDAAKAAPNEAPVFVLDEVTGKVALRWVTVGDLRGNDLEVFEGLEAGEKVVSAGVAFLRDGMAARAWAPRGAATR